MAVALVALFVALGGTSWAAVRLAANSVGTRQIKNKAVKLSKIDPTARTALRGQTGATGAPGANGANGKDGANGATGKDGVRGADGKDGAAGSIAYSGHVANLNTVKDSQDWATPTGLSIATGANSRLRDVLSPDVPITVQNLSVELTDAPGNGSLRTFYLVVDGVGSVDCTMISTQTACNGGSTLLIPPRSLISLRSDVFVADAHSGEAAFSWRAG